MSKYSVANTLQEHSTRCTERNLGMPFYLSLPFISIHDLSLSFFVIHYLSLSICFKDSCLFTTPASEQPLAEFGSGSPPPAGDQHPSHNLVWKNIINSMKISTCCFIILTNHDKITGIKNWEEFTKFLNILNASTNLNPKRMPVIHVQCEKCVNTETGDVEGEERDHVTNPAPVPKVWVKGEKHSNHW